MIELRRRREKNRPSKKGLGTFVRYIKYTYVPGHLNNRIKKSRITSKLSLHLCTPHTYLNVYPKSIKSNDFTPLADPGNARPISWLIPKCISGGAFFFLVPPQRRKRRNTVSTFRGLRSRFRRNSPITRDPIAPSAGRVTRK